MKLRNKKTGEIRETADVIIENLKKNGTTLNAINIDEIRNEWEDYEEPKEDGLDNIITLVRAYSAIDSERYPKETVEKLKAWKRLKDKGFRFDGYDVAHNSNGDLCGQLFYNAGDYCIEDVEKDLNLLFSGEDD